MDDFYDSAVLVSAQSLLDVVNYTHALNGHYIWELLTTLDYEWRVIRGHLPYRWTIWIYSFTRVTALVGVILSFAIMNVATPFNGQLWSSLTAVSTLCVPISEKTAPSATLLSFSQVFFSLSAITASLLNVLRIIAIWNRNKVVVTLGITVWGISVASDVLSTALLRDVRVPGQSICEPVKTESSILSFIPFLICDMALLLIMLIGLLILRRHGCGKFGLAHLLWKQGVIWLLLGTATEIPPLVLIALHLDYQFNVIFVSPFPITVIISSTRMHRYLVDFASRLPDIAHENLQVSSVEFSETNRTYIASTTLHRNEMAVDTASSETRTASAPPLPNVSLSPIPQTQNV